MRTRLFVGLAKVTTNVFKFLGIALDLSDVYRTAIGGFVLGTGGGGVGAAKMPWWYALALGIGVFLSTIGVVLLILKFTQRAERKYLKLPDLLRDMDKIMANEASRQAGKLSKNPKGAKEFDAFITQWTGATPKEKELLLQGKPLSVAKERQLGLKWNRNRRMDAWETISMLPGICGRFNIGLDTLENKNVRYALLSQQLYNMGVLPQLFAADVEEYQRLSLIQHTWEMLLASGRDILLNVMTPITAITSIKVEEDLKCATGDQLKILKGKIDDFVETHGKKKRGM